jgi:hypothetical protein
MNDRLAHSPGVLAPIKRDLDLPAREFLAQSIENFKPAFTEN